ncbi:hypothetical protein FM112_11465 [Gulosibacter sp. 10]|nr:hypothetical protein FM112_11465 [Gulosibacter sp. 10]
MPRAYPSGQIRPRAHPSRAGPRLRGRGNGVAFAISAGLPQGCWMHIDRSTERKMGK